MSVGASAADLIGRPMRPSSRSAARHAAAFLAVGAAIALLELRVADLDHGTHLLVVLTLVIGIALVFGRGPATTALAVGGIAAAAASVMSVDRVFSTPHAYVQVLTYLLAGTAFIELAPRAVRARHQLAFPASAQSTGAELPTAPEGPRPIEPLTARELEVLRLAANGISVDEIASRLFVSSNTAKTHLTHIYGKLGVRGRSAAVRAALHCGYLTATDICPHHLADEPTNSPVPLMTEHRNG